MANKEDAPQRLLPMRLRTDGALLKCMKTMKRRDRTASFLTQVQGGWPHAHESHEREVSCLLE